MQNQWGSWTCSSATREFHLGVMGDSDTWSALLVSSLLYHLVLTGVTRENPATQDVRMEAGFSVLFWQSQDIPLWLDSSMNADLKWSQIYFKGHCSSTKLIHLAYSQMGRRFIPYQFGCLLWLGNNAQTLLKAKIGDHEPSGRKMALAQSLSKSLLMFETFQKSLCSLVALIIPVWVWMKTF